MAAGHFYLHFVQYARTFTYAPLMDKVSPLVLHPASWILPSTEVEVEVEVVIQRKRLNRNLFWLLAFLNMLNACRHFGLSEHA